MSNSDSALLNVSRKEQNLQSGDEHYSRMRLLTNNSDAPVGFEEKSNEDESLHHTPNEQYGRLPNDSAPSPFKQLARAFLGGPLTTGPRPAATPATGDDISSGLGASSSWDGESDETDHAGPGLIDIAELSSSDERSDEDQHHLQALNAQCGQVESNSSAIHQQNTTALLAPVDAPPTDDGVPGLVEASSACEESVETDDDLPELVSVSGSGEESNDDGSDEDQRHRQALTELFRRQEESNSNATQHQQNTTALTQFVATRATDDDVPELVGAQSGDEESAETDYLPAGGLVNAAIISTDEEGSNENNAALDDEDHPVYVDWPGQAEANVGSPELQQHCVNSTVGEQQGGEKNSASQDTALLDESTEDGSDDENERFVVLPASDDEPFVYLDVFINEVHIGNKKI